MESIKNTPKKEYLIQSFFWLTLFSLHIIYFLQFPYFINKAYLFVQLGLNYGLFILVVNLFYYFLVPVVLKRRWWLFVLITLLLLTGLPLTKHYADVALMNFFESKHPLLYGIHVGFVNLFFMRFIVYAFWAALAVFIRLLADWFKTERHQLALRNQQLQSELAYLRAQVSPHFLFNTLNNIYALAYKKSEYTAEAVLKLSSMMRYMLYEANVESVPLNKEIENLQSFIALQKLRSKQQELVNFEITGQLEDKEIAPLLLIPLVENAFKHGNFAQAPVRIQLAVGDDQLSFSVENHYSAAQQKDTAGGVGLQNIQRRLALLYPNRHRMDICRDDETFKVTLSLRA